MSFDEFAKRIAADPDVAAQTAGRAAELARKPFHDAFLRDVYPHWQGPLATISRKPGIDRTAYTSVPSFIPAANQAEILRALGVDKPLSYWLISEAIGVESMVGVRAMVVYVFGGTENDGVMVRLSGYAETLQLMLSLPADQKIVRGPVPTLMAAAEADVQDAAARLGQQLLAGLEAREKRQREEKAVADQTAKAKANAEAKAKAEVEAKQKAQIEADAARVQAAKDAAAAPKTDGT